MTSEEKKVYDRIIKTVSTRIMEEVENVQSTRLGKRWEQDNGFYVTHLHIESVKSIGVRLHVAIQFLWYKNDSLLYQFFNHPDEVFGNSSTEVRTNKVPLNSLGLLSFEEHSVEEFEYYFTLLMTEARKFFDHYTAMKDLVVFQRALADKYARDKDVEIKHGRSGHGSDNFACQLAMISMLIGDNQTAIPLLKELAVESPYPFYVELAKQLLARVENREALLSYINGLVSDGRNTLSSKIKILGKSSFAFE